MQWDFSTVNDTNSFILIPAGVYPCRVADVRPGKARDGSERWRFRLEVTEGDFAGKTAAWDSVTWSERGIFRVKHVLAAFGFDVTREIEVEPEELEGRRATVQVEEEEWENPLTGETRLQLSVPYMGYALEAEPAPDAEVERWGEAEAQ